MKNHSTRDFLLVLACCFLYSHLSSQCPISKSCEDITSEETLSPVLSTASSIERSTYSVCLAESDVIEDGVFTNFVGDGVEVFIQIVAPSTTAVLFVETYTATGTSPVVTALSGSSCADVAPSSSTVTDYTPEVLSVRVEEDKLLYVLSIVVPVSDTFTEDLLTVEVFATEGDGACRDIDVDGFSPVYQWQISERSLASEMDSPFLPGEEIVFSIDFSFENDLTVTSEWLHGIIPDIGSGWVVEGTVLENLTMLASNGMVAEYYEKGDCGLIAQYDLPYFCEYTDEEGRIRICNMLTSQCPCKDIAIASEDQLPGGWAFISVGSSMNCTADCSPSTYWGVRSSVVDVSLTLPLRVVDSPTADADYRISLLAVTDALTGCYTGDELLCRPSVMAYSPDWDGLTLEDTFASVSLHKDTYCYQQPITVVASTNKQEDLKLSVVTHVPIATGFMVDPIPFEKDTFFQLPIENLTDTSFSVAVFLLGEGASGQVDTLSRDTALLLPKLRLFATGGSTCVGTCAEFTILNNHGVNYPIFSEIGSQWNPSGTDLLCNLDTMNLTVNIEGCDSDTLPLAVQIVDPIEMFFTVPDRICLNGEPEPEGQQFLITLDSVTGGSPPYTFTIRNLNSFEPSFELLVGEPFVIDEELLFGDATLFQVRGLSDGNCLTSTFVEIPILQDSLIDGGAFCKDGVFDLDQPLITLALQDFGKEVADFAWVYPTEITAVETEVGLVVNEEASTFGTYDILLEILFADGCSVTAIYSITIYNPNRGFIGEVTDFEVDFVPTDLLGIVSILWDFGDGNTSTDLFPTHIYSEVGTYTVTMSITDLCSTYEIMQDVIVSGTNTSEELASQLTVFPNPATTAIHITTEFLPMERVVLYDIAGKVVFSANTKSTHETIDVGEMPTGLYCIQISSKLGTAVRRVIIE